MSRFVRHGFGSSYASAALLDRISSIKVSVPGKLCLF